MVRLFKGTCLAIRAMHTYRAPVKSSASTNGNGNIPQMRAPPSKPDHDDHDDDERFPQPEGDGDGGYSYDDAVNVPLVTRQRVEAGDVVFDGDEELQENGLAQGDVHNTEIVPYAHRDLKPGYVFSLGVHASTMRE
jgi:serine/threonine kinase 16